MLKRFLLTKTLYGMNCSFNQNNLELFSSVKPSLYPKFFIDYSCLLIIVPIKVFLTVPGFFYMIK